MCTVVEHFVGQVAVVTGAGSGLGKAIAQGLADHGAEVVLIGRREAKLIATRQAIEERGGRATAMPVDVSHPEEVAVLADNLLDRVGVPSVLVNCAGVYGQLGPILQSDPARYRDTLLVNTYGAYLMCRHFAPGMVQMGWGRIVNVSSASSLGTPSSNESAYQTSKVALNQFTRQLAAELEGTGVTANVFHPGEVKTDMWNVIRDQSLLRGHMQRWVRMVEESGGDSPRKSVDLIMDLIKPGSERINGRFLWIKDGIKPPMLSWDNQ